MQEKRHFTVLGVCIATSLVFLAYLYQQIFSIPLDFPMGKNFTINENESLKSISNRLKAEKLISSPLLFRAGVSFLGKDRDIQLGGYEFATPLSLSGVISTFVQGRPHFPLLSVTIPEGSTSREIIALVTKALPDLPQGAFEVAIATYNANGRLFPSTYYLVPSYTADDIVKTMVNTFTKKFASLPIKKIPEPLTTDNEVIILASILEGEANNQEAMKIVAGILLTRLSKGMPLQVDVALETYKQKGLPKSPINNPGLTALDAVFHPIASPYLFYITGDDGKMYYAKTFEEHKKNIRKYLK